MDSFILDWPNLEVTGSKEDICVTPGTKSDSQPE